MNQTYFRNKVVAIKLISWMYIIILTLLSGEAPLTKTEIEKQFELERI